MRKFKENKSILECSDIQAAYPKYMYDDFSPLAAIVGVIGLL